MLFSKIYSAAIFGLDAHAIEVEIDISPGLPKFIIVGLPDAAVSESRERVRSAIRNSGFTFPMQRITANLAPANLKKEGSLYDIGLALGILAFQKVVSLPQEKCLFAGELSLQGEVRPIRGALSIAILAKREGFSSLFVPYSNAQEASMVSGIHVYGIRTFLDVVDHFSGKSRLSPCVYQRREDASFHSLHTFASVRGQYQAKRALAICAAGAHNILLKGSPGAGKTLLARTLPSLLPSLSQEESLEVTGLHSVAGELRTESSCIVYPPFRAPHHTASAVSLVGGGTIPHPGEISLAHRGVLFLDEMPEYPRQVLEVLRQPLEDGVITVTRASGAYTFPARFILVASQNPCPCGFYGDSNKECTCSSQRIEQYQRRISGPLLDRIDLHVSVPTLPFKEISSGVIEEDVEKFRKQVFQARQIQKERFLRNHSVCITNSEIHPRNIDVYCDLHTKTKSLLQKAVDSYHLSGRAYHRVLRVSRTIADFEGSENIASDHILEALQYR